MIFGVISVTRSRRGAACRPSRPSASHTERGWALSPSSPAQPPPHHPHFRPPPAHSSHPTPPAARTNTPAIVPENSRHLYENILYEYIRTKYRDDIKVSYSSYNFHTTLRVYLQNMCRCVCVCTFTAGGRGGGGGGGFYGGGWGFLRKLQGKRISYAARLGMIYFIDWIINTGRFYYTFRRRHGAPAAVLLVFFITLCEF